MFILSLWLREWSSLLDVSKENMRKVLQAATMDQLFILEGQLYEYVAMGSPLGSLMANAIMCKLEQQLENSNSLPRYYRRYVDDTFAIFSNITDQEQFFTILNILHPSISFTAELAQDNILPFIGINMKKSGEKLNTSVHHKKTDTGLLLHYHSHTNIKYKRSLLQTMIHRAYKICNSWKSLTDECSKLHTIFSKLHYPTVLIDRVISDTICKCRSKHTPTSRPAPASQSTTSPQSASTFNTSQPTQTSHPVLPTQSGLSTHPVRIILPFKSQKLSKTTRRELHSLNQRDKINIQAVFTSRKVKELVTQPETKEKQVSSSRVVYIYTCAACDMRYIGFTKRHLHQRVVEHRRVTSSIQKHCTEANHPFDESNFTIIAKCKSKLDLMVRESLEIYFQKPELNGRDEYSISRLYRLRF